MITYAQILAVGDNDIVASAYDESIPWKSPRDMYYFVQMTKGNPIIMGRVTFESFGSKPLPKRFNIVVTSSVKEAEYVGKNLVFVPDLTTAKQYAEKHFNDFNAFRLPRNKVCYIIGGIAIYRATIGICDFVLLNKIDFDPISDLSKYRQIDMFYLRGLLSTRVVTLNDLSDPLREVNILYRKFRKPTNGYICAIKKAARYEQHITTIR